MTKKSRFIRNVDDQVWFKFAGYSKIEGKTQAQFLSSLIKLYEQIGEEDLETLRLLKKFKKELKIMIDCKYVKKPISKEKMWGFIWSEITDMDGNCLLLVPKKTLIKTTKEYINNLNYRYKKNIGYELVYFEMLPHSLKVKDYNTGKSLILNKGQYVYIHEPINKILRECFYKEKEENNGK